MALLRFSVLVLLLGYSNAHSAGAPSSACNSLTPDHGPGTTITSGGQPPYTLDAPARVAPGAATTVSISGAPFKGFIVRAMDAQGNNGGASFLPGTGYQTLDCNAPDDTATHVFSGNGVNSVKLQWSAPKQPGMYRIVATIVKSYSEIYTGYFTDVRVQ
ncbi:defense protein l(2)34Fc [Hyalella azteca]|uniref:Defense protein l(2)34Fc n=1 Tax=Hyalella azteca TaxID=294128 RepID=A0A8B7N4B5_HYAAZ|nr:defense protein l(2)34Fc [Hyalella azteca]